MCLSNKDYDIRKTNDARFMDQKVTPDVLSCVSECIIRFLCKDINKSFYIKDIQDLDYSHYIVRDIFNKPEIESATNEYNKFFSQPIKMLSYSGILLESKHKNRNVYRVKYFYILEKIASSDRKAYEFLTLYLEKVLMDSGIFYIFKDFFDNEDKKHFSILKDRYIKFIIDNTSINKEKEASRIFTKVLNPLSCKYKKLGTKKGYISNKAINFSDLLYNNINFRDIKKDKNITRDEFLEKNKYVNSIKYLDYNIQKAKNLVKKLHPYSEIHRLPKYKATQAHHIFAISEFPELADKIENIIALTPNQHLLYAHPQNNTNEINKSYQYLCLIYKLDSIEIDYNNNLQNYNLHEFIDVINYGLKLEIEYNISFEELKLRITKYYTNN